MRKKITQTHCNSEAFSRFRKCFKNRFQFFISIFFLQYKYLKIFFSICFLYRFAQNPSFCESFQYIFLLQILTSFLKTILCYCSIESFLILLWFNLFLSMFCVSALFKRYTHVHDCRATEICFAMPFTSLTTVRLNGVQTKSKSKSRRVRVVQAMAQSFFSDVSKGQKIYHNNLLLIYIEIMEVVSVQLVSVRVIVVIVLSFTFL